MERKTFLKFLGASVVSGSLMTFINACKKTDTSTLENSTNLIQQQILNVGKLVVTEGHFAEVLTYKDKDKYFGGMVSFTLRGGFEAARTMSQRTQLFLLAESLGGVESLMCHPVSMTHGSIPKEVREARGVTDSLLRLSVGIEDVEDLLADLTQALEVAVSGSARDARFSSCQYSNSVLANR